MIHKYRQCADAGSPSCPCRLAEYGECLICSRLAGKGCCDCGWQGICVYNEYIQNGRCIRERRTSDLYRIEKMTWYDKDLVVMRLSVPRGLAEKASLPGSFVFLKSPDAEQFFSVPISVLAADYEAGMLDLAIKVAGPKTQNLAGWGQQNAVMYGASPAGKQVAMRGIYRNGLLGVEKLMAPGPKRVLCMTKGVGLAPAVNYIKWADGKDHIDVIADLEKINRRFAGDVLSGCKINSVDYRRLPLHLEEAVLESYDVVMICASDFYQSSIAVPEHKKVVSNNCSMCCGEGICGACMHTDKNGKGHRMCKCSQAPGF